MLWTSGRGPPGDRRLETLGARFRSGMLSPGRRMFEHRWLCCHRRLLLPAPSLHAELEHPALVQPSRRQAPR